MTIDLHTTLQGKKHAYTLTKVLVDGRFGATYLARNEDDGSEVIFKTIDLPGLPDWDTREAFEREGTRLRQLKHPNIAPYQDQALIEKGLFGKLALIQAHVEGASLADALERQETLPLKEALAWFGPLLQALHYTHTQFSPPILHGDIDPGNILLTEDGPLLVDFATLRQASLSSEQLAAGLVVGHLDYSPMDQLMGSLFPSSDLYALAMTFLAAVSGTPPKAFPKKGLQPDVEALIGHIAPDDLVELLVHMTQPDPSNRLDNAQVAYERVKTIKSRASNPSLSFTQPTHEEAPSQRLQKTKEASKDQRSPAEVFQHSASLELPQDIDPNDFWDMPSQLKAARVHAFGINVDGTTLVLGHEHDATVLSASKFKARGSMDFDEMARRVAVSRNGRRVAVLTGFERLLLYDVEVTTWLKHDITVDGMWPGNSQLTFSPDGDLVAISDDDQVNVYRWSTGELVERYDVDGQFGLCFDPQSKLIFAIGAQHTTIIDEHTHHTLEGIDGLVFSPDGTKLAVSRGNTVEYGPFHGLTPTLSWDHTRIAISDHKGDPLRMLAFSPNQNYLVAASHQGQVRLLDLTQNKEMPWHDERATHTPQVKLFAVGFGPDSQHVLAHATRSPNDAQPEKLGCVLSWSVPRGKFLGALLWLNGDLSVWSAQGFWGRLSDVDSGGISLNTWQRPGMAARGFQGRPIEEGFSPKERTFLREIHHRQQDLRRLWTIEEESWDFPEVLDATRGLTPWMAEIWHRAQLKQEAADASGLSYMQRTRTTYLTEAASDLRDMDTTERASLLESQHHYIQSIQSSQDDASPRQDVVNILAAKIDAINSRPVTTQQPSDDALVIDDIEEEGYRSYDDQEQEVPTFSKRSMPESDIERIRRESNQSGQVITSETKLGSNTKHMTKTRAPQSVTQTESHALDPIKVILCTALGFAIPFGILLGLEINAAQSPVFFYAILGLGPILAFVYYKLWMSIT